MGLIPIRSSQTISLDSNIFIRALDDNGPLGNQARILLKHIKQIKPRISISTILLEEFFVKVFKQKRESEINYIMDFLTLGGLVSVLDIDKEIAIMAAKIRARYGIKAPDAIHLASAISGGAKFFITTDKRLSREVAGLKVVVLQKETDL